MTDARSPTEFALDVLKEHLRPFIEPILAEIIDFDIHPEKSVRLSRQQIVKKKIERFNADPKNKGNRKHDFPIDISTWSPEYFLRVLYDHREHFQHKMNGDLIGRNSHRHPITWPGWAAYLDQLRNRWAHRLDYTDREEGQFLDDAWKLLTTCGAYAGATAIRKKQDALRSTVPLENVSADTDLEVRQILRSDEPDFLRFLRLMEREFPDPAIRASNRDLADWLDNHETYLKQEPFINSVYLIAKDRASGIGVGLLLASIFESRKRMFICYLAHDRQLALEMRNKLELRLSDAITFASDRSLLQKLFEITGWNKGIVAEVPRNDAYVYLKEVFQFQSKIFGTKAYLLPVDYLQPALDPRLYLNDLENNSPTHDLLYLPSPSEHAAITEAGGLPCDDVIEILDFIYRDVYAVTFDKFPDEDRKRYRAHIEELRDFACDGLPKLVPLRDISVR